VLVSSNRADAIGLAVAIVAVAVVIIWILYGLKRVFTYGMRDSTMEIRVFGTTVQRVLFSDIERVEVIPFLSLVPLTRSFRPDLFISLKWCGYNKTLVAVKRHSGLIKRIIISPENPEALASSLKARARERLARVD
jgi:hypothetical protein